MVMLDRRMLAAPLFAQAAAFVVVLVIGGFTGHAKTTPGPGSGVTPSASASPSATKGPALKLTVKVVEEGTDGLSVSGSQVNVLENGTLASAVSGTLNSALEFAQRARWAVSGVQQPRSAGSARSGPLMRCRAGSAPRPTSGRLPSW